MDIAKEIKEVEAKFKELTDSKNQKLAEINKLNSDITNIDQELFRLQGEYSVLNKLNEEASKNTKVK